MQPGNIFVLLIIIRVYSLVLTLFKQHNNTHKLLVGVVELNEYCRDIQNRGHHTNIQGGV